MKIKPFELERYFAKYEFSVKYLLSSSDCDGMKMTELLELADPETKRLWENLTLGYTESQGLPLLRNEIAKLYQGVAADDVLVAAPEECIFLAMNALLEEGDNIICTYPGYQSLYEIAQSLGCSVTKWQPDEDVNWQFDPDFLRKSITPKTKLIIVNFPHNPTGSLPYKAMFDEIVAIAKEKNICLFSDEMYRFLEYNAEDRLPSAVEIYDNAISLFGMSKTFGLAGLRIGWLATKNKALYKKMATLKDYTTICSPAPSEILALIGLRAKETIIADNLTKIERNLGVLEQFLARHPDTFSWVKPKAGTICFPKLLLGMDATDFCERVVEDAKLMVLPSSVYGYDDKHIRIGFGRDNMPEALDVLEKWLNR
jgi:aspartate/methionine/tyrosine aminotransferase